jgi:guanyl-specific ribonuclease Sa
MKIKKLLSLLLSLIFAVTAISGCGGIELGDILEEVEYLAGLESEYTDDTTTEPLDDVKSEQTDTSQETETTNQPEDVTTQKPDITQETETIDEYGTYTSKEDVALYIHTYRKLPPNFITKNEARDLGWQGGGLEDYAPGKCIGGDYFGNFEGLLPEKDGREYTECDIDTLGKSSRGAKRIVFSNDGLIYYTDDHYESFTLLYGKEE